MSVLVGILWRCHKELMHVQRKVKKSCEPCFIGNKLLIYGYRQNKWELLVDIGIF